MNLHNLKTLATQDLYVTLEVQRRKVSLMSSARSVVYVRFSLVTARICFLILCNLIEIYLISAKLHGVMSKIAVTLPRTAVNLNCQLFHPQGTVLIFILC